MENIHLLIFFWWIKCFRFSGRFTIYLVRSASICVWVCVTARDVNKGRETVAAVQMTDCMTGFVRECVCPCVCMCVLAFLTKIGHPQRRLCSVNRLIRRLLFSALFLIKRTRSHICLWLKRVLTSVRGAHWEEKKRTYERFLLIYSSTLIEL